MSPLRAAAREVHLVHSPTRGTVAFHGHSMEPVRREVMAL